MGDVQKLRLSESELPNPCGEIPRSIIKSQVDIHGNTFMNLNVSGSGLDGLCVNDASCENILLVGAQFVGNQGACVSEAVAGSIEQVGVICR